MTGNHRPGHPLLPRDTVSLEAVASVERLGPRVVIEHPQISGLVPDRGWQQTLASTRAIERPQDVDALELVRHRPVIMSTFARRRPPNNPALSLPNVDARGVVFDDRRPIRDARLHFQPIKDLRRTNTQAVDERQLGLGLRGVRAQR